MRHQQPTRSLAINLPARLFQVVSQWRDKTLKTMSHGRFTGNFHVKKMEKCHLFFESSETNLKYMQKKAQTGNHALSGVVRLHQNR